LVLGAVGGPPQKSSTVKFSVRRQGKTKNFCFTQKKRKSKLLLYVILNKKISESQGLDATEITSFKIPFENV